MKEDTKKGIFGLYPDSECELLELEIDDSTYDNLLRTLEFYLSNYDRCKYKFSAVIPMMLGIKQNLRLKMTCSQFVATLLDKSGISNLPKHPSLMYPCDFLKIANIKGVYKGSLRNLCFPK